jgi:hypothetical protein
VDKRITLDITDTCNELKKLDSDGGEYNEFLFRVVTPSSLEVV